MASTTQRDICIESSLPVVSANGLNTLKNIDFDSGSNTCALPASTTIGGQSVVALGNITSSATTGASFSVTNTGVYTGVGMTQFIADSATTGVNVLMTGNGLTTGTVLSLTSTGTIVTTGEVLNVVANNATTSTGLVRISGTGLTSGSALAVVGGGANITSGSVTASVSMGAATTGIGLQVITTGVYTGGAGNGVLNVTANSATTVAGGLVAISGTGLTTGIALRVVATAATLTTGFYAAFNDGALNVLTIGANGHITSNQTTAPTIAVTSQAGITAAAVTAGSTDTTGNITTTGTSTGATILDVTFHKTYTVAPKFVMLAPANAAAAAPNTGYYVSAISATTFTITVAAGGTYAATPSWRYLVIA